MVSSTVLTLLVIPSVYVLADQLKSRLTGATAPRAVVEPGAETVTL